MVEIKPWSIEWLNFFKKWQKCFQALIENFGHQLFVTTINDQNFPIPQFNNQKFSDTQVDSQNFLGINKLFFQLLDQWSLLIRQLKNFGELPMFLGILNFLIVDYGDKKLVTKKF
jgi:hypothetical protein